MSDTVHAMADRLRQYATHFTPQDWDYTRNLGDLREIRRDREVDTLRRRVKAAARDLVGSRSEFLKSMEKDLGVKVGRWRCARTSLRRDPHLPDGVLDGGGILTYWEETGEYLQYVQPSVGALLADLMDAHPDLPEVRAVAVEMKRINDRYGERVAAGL